MIVGDYLENLEPCKRSSIEGLWLTRLELGHKAVPRKLVATYAPQCDPHVGTPGRSANKEYNADRHISTQNLQGPSTLNPKTLEIWPHWASYIIYISAWI